MVVLDVLKTVEVGDRLKTGEGGVDPGPKYTDEILGGVSIEFDDGGTRVDRGVVWGSGDALDQRWCWVA